MVKFMRVVGVVMVTGMGAWSWGAAGGVGSGALAGGPPGAAVASDPRIDAATGRDAAHWPPDRPWDHEHIRIEVRIEDMESKRLEGNVELTARAVGASRRRMRLDAGSTMTITQVEVDGVPAKYAHEGEELAIDMPKETAAGQKVTVRIAYTAKEPYRDGNGLNWLGARAAEGSSEAREAQIYSQGESEWNHLWFPCHDFPDEKLTSEVIATVPAGLEVVSNGRLVSRERGGEKDGPRAGLERWHWVQDKPHSVYLITLVVGTFDVVEVGGAETARPGLSMRVYGKPGTAESMKKAYANTPRMVKFLETYFDEAYPWDKYAQVMVREFRWGGMENTSATTLTETTGHHGEGPTGMDALIVHELGHQWTGDLVTCASWEHLWLNEGWATFIEWLWVQQEAGDEAYLSQVRSAIGQVGPVSVVPLPGGVPMVSRLYPNPDEPFEKADDPYQKGGLVLHMLRERLGKEVFRRGAAAYIDRFKYGCAETDDFRREMEAASGESLERFFDQWCRRTGLPSLSADVAWKEEAGMLTIMLAQTQTIDADNPAYALEVPVLIQTEGQADRWVTVHMETRSTATSVKLEGKPSGVKIDPRLTCGARVTMQGNIP